MNNGHSSFVWVFNGAGAKVPSGVFAGKSEAIAWISKHKLTGLLTKYPMNVGLYDWALEMKYFEPRRDDQKTPDFIARFTCASLEHYHCEDGVIAAGG
jgi:hypothetical protein